MQPPRAERTMDVNEFLAYLERSNATAALAASVTEIVYARRTSAQRRARAAARAVPVPIDAGLRALAAS